MHSNAKRGNDFMRFNFKGKFILRQRLKSLTHEPLVKRCLSNKKSHSLLFHYSVYTDNVYTNVENKP